MAEPSHRPAELQLLIRARDSHNDKMSAQLKARASMATRMKNRGLTLNTAVPRTSKVGWELINSAPVTKKETSLDSQLQQNASSSRRIEALASADWRNTMVGPKVTGAPVGISAESTKDKSEADDDGSCGLDSPSIPANEFSGSSRPADNSDRRRTKRSTTVDGIHENEEFIDTVFDLHDFTRPGSSAASLPREARLSQSDVQEGELRELEECGWDMKKFAAQKMSMRKETMAERKSEPWAIPEANEHGACFVKLDTMYGLTQRGRDAGGGAKNVLLSVETVTRDEMKYISSSCAATRTPLAKLHVARHRSRLLSSQDDTDAHQAERATLEIPRAASVSPEFLSKDATARYDTVMRTRDARRLQYTDPAVAGVYGITSSDEDIAEISPGRVSPTTAARSAARQRFGEMIRRLKLSARSESDDASDRTVISGETKEPEQQQVDVDDLLAARMKWETALRRLDSGGHCPPRDVEDGRQARVSSGGSGSVVSAESSPVKLSHDSGYDSPSKAKTLNPKASEFVSVKEKIKPAATVGDARRSRSPRKPVSGIFAPSQPTTSPARRPMLPPGLPLAPPNLNTDRFAPLDMQAALNIHDPSVRAMMASSMLPPPGAFHPLATPQFSSSALPAFAPTHPLPPMGPVVPLQQVTPVLPPALPQIPRAGPLVAGKPPPPCRKPRMPDAAAQQHYEAYIEHRKLMDPEYALKCKRRQAKRWERQRQDPEI